MDTIATANQTKGSQSLTGREKALYAYLLSQDGHRCSKRDIVDHVPGYEWNEKAWDKCATIRKDMKDINHVLNPDYQKIIVFADQMYYMATKNEAVEYRAKKIRSLKARVRELKDLDAKMGLDGQGSLNGDWWDPYIPAVGGKRCD